MHHFPGRLFGPGEASESPTDRDRFRLDKSIACGADPIGAMESPPWHRIRGGLSGANISSLFLGATEMLSSPDSVGLAVPTLRPTGRMLLYSGKGQVFARSSRKSGRVPTARNPTESGVRRPRTTPREARNGARLRAMHPLPGVGRPEGMGHAQRSAWVKRRKVSASTRYRTAFAPLPEPEPMVPNASFPQMSSRSFPHLPSHSRTADTEIPGRDPD